MIIKKNIAILIITFGVITIAAGLLLNYINIEIRLKELIVYLQQQNRSEFNNDHIYLISHYSLRQKLYRKQVTGKKADQLEFKFQQLLQSQKEQSPVALTQYSFIAKPALLMINFNRSLLGKPPITNVEYYKTSSTELDRAFYFERNNLFKEALLGYSKILQNQNYDPAIKGNIMLHKGYCLAMTGDIYAAKKMYESVIKEFHGEGSAITASVLLSYLDYFSREKEKILHSSYSRIDKAEKLYQLLVFNESLRIIKILEKDSQHGNNPRFMLLKALCYNGIGKVEKASGIFLDLIEQHPSSKYARFANRRLFLLGVKTDNDTFIKSVQRLNIYLRDPILQNMIISKTFSSKKKRKKFPMQNRISLPSVRIKKIENKLARREKSYLGFTITMKTKGGDTLIGRVMEDSRNLIVLQTKIGIIRIKKNDIKSIREKVKPKN